MTNPSKPQNFPSWQRWPPNCCQTCVGPWLTTGIPHEGYCQKADSLEFGTKTDSRFRCVSFQRKADPSNAEN